MAILFSNNLSIKDLSILKQTETPGLGSRITESSFTDQFIGLSVSEVALKADNGRIDAITGATISSEAVVDTVREKMVGIIDSLQN